MQGPRSARRRRSLLGFGQIAPTGAFGGRHEGPAGCIRPSLRAADARRRLAVPSRVKCLVRGCAWMTPLVYHPGEKRVERRLDRRGSIG
jgi:hypothetical protein